MLAQHEHRRTELSTSGFYGIIQVVQLEVRKAGQNEGPIPQLCVCVAASDGAYCEMKHGNSLKIPQLFYEEYNYIALCVY